MIINNQSIIIDYRVQVIVIATSEICTMCTRKICNKTQSSEQSQKNVRMSTQTIVSVSQRRDTIVQNISLIIECRETAFIHLDRVYDVVRTI